MRLRSARPVPPPPAGVTPVPRRGPGIRFSVAVIVPLSRLLTTRVWEGRHLIPRSGGVIIAANHLSWVDPLTFAHYVYASGRLPRFMAKESLFRMPLVGAVLRSADQIPVHRGERDGPTP